MGKRERRSFTEDFNQEAVRLTETSGRTIVQVAEDLGLGLSTLTHWKRQYREASLHDLGRLQGIVQKAGVLSPLADGCFSSTPIQRAAGWMYGTRMNIIIASVDCGRQPLRSAGRGAGRHCR